MWPFTNKAEIDLQNDPFLVSDLTPEEQAALRRVRRERRKITRCPKCGRRDNPLTAKMMISLSCSLYDGGWSSDKSIEQALVDFHCRHCNHNFSLDCYIDGVTPHGYLDIMEK